MSIYLRYVKAIDLSSLISSLYVVKKSDKGKTYPANPIYGEHVGASCYSVYHCVRKLKAFL